MICIFVGLILMLCHREMHINPQRNRHIIVDLARIELMTSKWGNSASCQLSSTFASSHWNCVKNTIPMTCSRLHWTTDNPSGMHGCQFQYLCVLIFNCALALAIYIFISLILMLWHRETHINSQRTQYLYAYIYIYMHIYIYTHADIYIYRYIYIQREIMRSPCVRLLQICKYRTAWLLCYCYVH